MLLDAEANTRAVETARQLSLALSAMTQGVGANAGVNGVNQELAAITGQDINLGPVATVEAERRTTRKSGGRHGSDPTPL